MSSGTPSTEHVDELLSGYVDNELTQQQRQRVEVHCATCTDCHRELNELGELRHQVRGSTLSQIDKDVWREHIDDLGVNAARGLGWLLIVAGLMAAGGFYIYDFLFHSGLNLTQKLIGASIYLGGALLLLSVIRQRLIERKTDKYKDVEI